MSELSKEIDEMIQTHPTLKGISMTFSTFKNLRLDEDLSERFKPVIDRPTLEKGLYGFLDDSIEIRVCKNTPPGVIPTSKINVFPSEYTELMDDSILVIYLTKTYSNESFIYKDLGELVQCIGDKGTKLVFKWADLFNNKTIPL